MGIEELVRLARGGDLTAREELVLHYAPQVSRYVTLHLGGNARRWTESCDIATHVLFEVLGDTAKLPEDISEEEIAQRLNQVAKWRIRDSVRNHREVVGESVLPPGAQAAAMPPTTGPVTHADQQRWVEDLVARLPAKDADVVRLVALDGLSYEETGKRLALAADTVRKRYTRARDRLAEKLAGGRAAGQAGNQPGDADA